ncbi:MAG: glycosyltransferase [Pirellulales bacterium]|nr:glycosyltransferase [Pirellulales bacterium]
MFITTSMPVGGAETLLVDLVRRMDRSRFSPELCCLKFRGPLGYVLAEEIPTFSGLLTNKYDFGVLARLKNLMLRRHVDAVVTVGTGGDRMFWGRLAARWAGVPVICSALHSTGLPDRVEFSNRLLTPITDAFIAVAKPHGLYLTTNEGCPASKVRVICNGVDVEKFHPRWPVADLRKEFDLPQNSPVVGIIAALRPEKRHDLFLRSAQIIRREVPQTKFLIVGDGPQREELERLAGELSLNDCVRFLGSRDDVPQVLSLLNVFMLTSQMEANPVSILEAMASEKPVVAPNVGSIPETVVHGKSGFLFEAEDVESSAAMAVDLLACPQKAEEMGRHGREQVITNWSVDRMVEGYQDMIAEIYTQKARGKKTTVSQDKPRDESVKIEN